MSEQVTRLLRVGMYRETIDERLCREMCEVRENSLLQPLWI